MDASGGRSAPARSTSDARLREIARALEATPFRPHPLFRNGHAQTLAAYVWPRRRLLREDERRTEPRLFEVEPGVRLLARCRWQRRRRDCSTVILLHGLEGSTSSVYMLGTARKAFHAGFNVVSVNMRNCGGTEHLTPTLYHSGMSDDMRAVLSELISADGLTSLYVAGFSMGGQLVLKLAGELGEAAPPELRGVCAVSPSIDLGACADAVARRANRLYERTFVNSLRRRIRHKQKLYPHLYDTRDLRLVRSIRDFDNRYTALHGGFRDAADYYERVSAIRFISRIRTPTLIIHAQDDPLIPFHSFRNPALAANPRLVLLTPAHGGHVGFVADATPGEDRFWAENRIVEFCRLVDSAR